MYVGFRLYYPARGASGRASVVCQYGIRYRKLFKDNGMNYDLRNYTDEDGTVYLPWMFSKTLEHDPKTGFAKKSDIDLATCSCSGESRSL